MTHRRPAATIATRGLMTFGLTGHGASCVEWPKRPYVPLDDMGMVESIDLALLHWLLNDVFAPINSEGRYAGK